jgi:hypothetical protein
MWKNCTVGGGDTTRPISSKKDSSWFDYFQAHHHLTYFNSGQDFGKQFNPFVFQVHLFHLQYFHSRGDHGVRRDEKDQH